MTIAPLPLAVRNPIKAHASARRERKRIPTAKETPPMPSDPYHRPGQVVEEPVEETQRREQAAAARQAAAPPDFPPKLMPYIHACEGVYSVPNFRAVEWQGARDLTRAALDYPERDREDLVTALVDRFLRRAARGGRA